MGNDNVRTHALTMHLACMDSFTMTTPRPRLHHGTFVSLSFHFM